MYQSGNTLQACDDPAHERLLQDSLHTPSVRWGRNPGITWHWIVKQIDGVVPAWCSFYWKVILNRLWYFICVRVENIPIVLCFSTRRGDARVSAPSCTGSVEGILEQFLMCWVITGFTCVFTLIQVRLSDFKKIP